MKTVILCTTALISIVFASCELPRGSVFRRQSIVSSIKDPAYWNKNFNCVVIFADTNDLEIRLQIEKNVAEYFRLKGFCVTTGLVHFPPTRHWSDEDRRKFYQLNNVDAYLVISTMAAGENEEYIPPVTTITRTVTKDKLESENQKDTVRKQTRTNEVEKEKITTETSGGYTKYHPWVKYSMRLYDARTDQTAWMGIATTKGKTEFSLAYDIVERLIGDGLFIEPKVSSN